MFSSSCSGREAPISADVTTGSRSTHWIASCASVCPRSFAMTSRPRRVASPFGDSVARGSDERFCARSAVPSPRYLSVSRPCASGVKAIAPMPSCFSTPVRPSSTQRLRIEYDGWWITSGVPRLRATAAAVAVRSALYDEMPTYSALPCRTSVSRAPMVSSIGVTGSTRCE